MDGTQDHDQGEEKHGNDLQGEANVQLELPKAAKRIAIVVATWQAHSHRITSWLPGPHAPEGAIVHKVHESAETASP